ncbi:MAG: DUF484 family protein, partial [Gammaproteobacteria bacterium]
MSEADTKNTIILNPADISEYLLSHPEFFIEHPEVL